MKKLLLLAAVVGALSCPALPGLAAAGGTYSCTGTIGLGTLPGQFIPSTIDVNVDVPAGATCSMYVTTVTGNVTVEGTLYGFGNTFEKNLIVDGGSVSLGCGFSILCAGHAGSVVLGNAVMTNAGRVAPIQTHFAQNLTINGVGSADLELMGVDGRVMVANSRDVLLFSAIYGDDVSLINNSGDVLVADVNIAGTLKCEANTPPPTVGVGVNAAAYRGQCAASP